MDTILEVELWRKQPFFQFFRNLLKMLMFSTWQTAGLLPFLRCFQLVSVVGMQNPAEEFFVVYTVYTVFRKGMVDFTGRAIILQWICLPMKNPGGIHEPCRRKRQLRTSDKFLLWEPER